MKKTTLILILVLSTILMSCGEPDPEAKDYDDENNQIIETLNIGGSEVRLTVAASNIERAEASDKAAVDQNAEVYNGILFVYDGNSPIIFRQKMSSYATDVAFLDANGEVTSIIEFPPTPHNPESINSYQSKLERYKYFASQRGENFDANNEEAYKQYFKKAAVAEGFIQWSFPQASVVKVKYAVQLPSGFFSKHKVKAGNTIALTENMKKLTGETPKPVIEFVYEEKTEMSENRVVKKKLFNVDMAETMDKRSNALSADRLNNLKDDEIIALMWNTKKQINLNAIDSNLAKPFYIVPVEIPEQKRTNSYGEIGNSYISGEFILMEPTSAPPNEIDGNALPQKQSDPSYRNFAFTSIDKYNCLLIMSRESINTLKLKENMFSCAVPPDFFNIKTEDDPEKFDVVYKLSKTGEKIEAKVKVIQDEIGRRRGLKLANPLPKYVKDEENKTAAEGYLLRFDRVRVRPVYSAELKAPFDLALLDSSSKIVKVIEIPDEKTLSTMKIYGELMDFSEQSYQAIWIMPFKWFNFNGLATTNDVGEVNYAKGSLNIARAISTTTPEPTRYKILVNDIPVWVELMINTAERERGLQYVQELKPNSGALFLYKDRNEVMEFWMPNCLMDLSILYIDKNWFGKSVKQMLHPFDPSLPSDSEARRNRPENERTSLRMFASQYNSKYKVEYALEMERGWFLKNNLARYKDDKYNTTETPGEYYTQVELIGVPKVTIIKGSPVEKFLELVK